MIRPGMNRQPAGELNFVDRINQALALDTTGTVLLLNGTVPGTNEFNRIGRKITMKAIRLRFGLFPAAPAAGQNEALRILLVYDRQSNGAAPAWADVIQSQDAAGTTSSTAWDHRNESNRDRFVVLRDWHFKATGAAGIFANSLDGTEFTKDSTYDVYVRLKGLETHYNTGTAGTIADITTGALFMMSLGTSAAVNASRTCAVHSRVNFIA